MSVFQRRLASSTYALLRSFERRIEKLDAIIDDVQMGRLSIEQLLTLQQHIKDDHDVFDSKTADDESSEGDIEENEAAEDELLTGVIAVSLGDLIAEKEQVLQLRDLAQQIYDDGQESKFEKLREVITEDRFVGEKLIVFTEHKDTLSFLIRRLDGMGYTGQVATIHGGMHYTNRQEQVEFFRKSVEDGGARFMICTDAAAEGINLQFCWIMINYDVPWNPARLEQRMGRIHRYGQKHDPVVILNLVAPATREGRVLKTLLDKLEKIRKQLKSDKVYDSIGRIFSEVSIKQYMEMAVMDGAEAIIAQLDGQMTEEQVLAIEELEKRLYGDGGDVARELPRLRESLEQEVFFRLLPGYVRKFVSSAAPLVGMKVDGDLGDFFDLKPTQVGALDPLLTILETYSDKQRFRLSVLRPEDRQSCIWMHPGEPVFEGFREIVRSRLGKDALQGAIFVDPTATKPYIFHLARLTVVRKADPDLSELGQEDTLACQLVGVRQTEGTDISLCSVEHLLFLKGGQGLPREAQRLAVMAEKYRDLARSYLAERVARTMSVERRGKILDSLPEREAFVKQGYDHQEAELAAVRSKLSQKAREGNKAAAQHLAEVKAQQRALSARKERSLTVLHREPELIVPGDVDFIAHALVVPSTDKADQEEHEHSVEQVAMDLTRAYEEAAGAKVKFVHTPPLARAAGLSDHPGFDVLSIHPNGERRCIEVKGRFETGEIQMYDNEWAKACNLRKEFWLYVVYHCGTSTPEMMRVQDPFEKLLVRPFTKTQQVSGVRIGHVQIMDVGELS